jgi:O-antigen/teichoic acid export membrane protein
MDQSPSNKIIENILWNFTGQGWLLILAFFAMPYIIHHLTVELFGIYILVSIVVDYFAFLQLGMGAASVKYISQYLATDQQEDIRLTFWSGIIAHAVMGFLGTLSIFIFADALIDKFFTMSPNLKETALFALRVGSIGFLVSMLIGMVSSVIRATSRFDQLNRIGIIFGTLQIGSTVLLLHLDYSLKEIVAINVVIQTGSLCVQWILVRKLLPCLSNVSTNIKTILHLLKFGGFVTISSIVGPILTNIEKILLTSLRSVSALTYYTVPFSLVGRLAVIPSSFSSVLFPAYSYYQESEKKEVNQELHFRSTLYILLILLFPVLFFMFYGHSFLTLWVGDDFAEYSTNILIILSLASLVNAAAYPSITALQGIGKPQLPAYFHLVEMIIYIPTVYLLIKEYGGIGAASAWLLRVLFDVVLLQYASCKFLSESLFEWYQRLISRSVWPITIGVFSFIIMKTANLALTHPLSIGGILVTGAVYSFAVWKISFDDTTRARCTAVLNGIKI